MSHATTPPPTDMLAAGFDDFGGADVLTMVRVPVPRPGPGQVLIRSHATAVNPADTLFRSGGLRPAGDGVVAPWIPGLEVAGSVVEVGDDVTHLSPGDEVVAYVSFAPTGRGTHSEYVVTPASTTARIPSGLDRQQASTLPMNGLTARMALDVVDLPPGDTVVVIGAGGAVGSFLVQLARQEGVRTLALASRADHDRLLALGATEVDEPSERDVPALGRRAAARGVRAVVDLVGVDWAPGLLPRGGRLIVVRPPSSAPHEGVRVTMIKVSDYIDGDTTRLATLVDLVAAGNLQLPAVETFAPGDAAEAHDFVDRRGKCGVRPVLVWDGGRR